MTTTAILGILTSLIAGEITGISPWCAKKLARWSALRRYADNPERAKIRAEELAALIESRPGNLLKLLTALGFAAVGLAKSLFKAARRGATKIAPEAPPLLVLPQVVPQTATPGPPRPADGSFSAFYRHTYPRLVRSLARLDGHGGLSEDVAQAAMIVACEKWDSLLTYARPDAWVFTVASRMLRRKELQERNQLSLQSADIAEEGPSDRIEINIDIASALDNLPSRQAEVIRLHVLKDYSRAKVAEMLNISVSSVDRDLRAGLAYLREQLSSWREPQGT